MRPPYAQQPERTHGIAALIGGMLGALLYALLGGRGVRRRDAVLDGALAGVMAAQAAIRLEPEPEIEWEWVPAPWRNGRLLPVRHARALGVALPLRRARPCVLGRGPPCGFAMPLGLGNRHRLGSMRGGFGVP
ncbi:MAG: hypothetical protein NT133_19310 [Alphaproteobacteria bacterium]|nr:hypothetical protein [Alphaproteobacteria bacterium]